MNEQNLHKKKAGAKTAKRAGSASARGKSSASHVSATSRARASGAPESSAADKRQSKDARADKSGTCASIPEMRDAEFARKLGMRLQELRWQKDLTQEVVAHLAGISTFTYQKFEKGESNPGTPMNPRLFTLLALADVFDMSILELLDIDSSPNELPVTSARS